MKAEAADKDPADMTPQEKEAAAQALYERGVPIGPSWDQLGSVTKSVWIEDVERGITAGILAAAARNRGDAPAPAAPASTSALSDFIRNATPERKAEVFEQVMDKVIEQQKEVIERAKTFDPGSQGALF